MPEAMLSVAIVDYGLGNLYSVKRACEAVGHLSLVTSDAADLERASVVILPGVGAFGDAMHSLRVLRLVEPLREMGRTGKPIVGICLGLQLLMERSCEFGAHEGLGLIAGEVVRFSGSDDKGKLRVPHLGWNRIRPVHGQTFSVIGPLAGIPEGTFMYFVHSFYAKPADARAVESRTTYGPVEFCSSVLQGNIFGCQFHPERSGPHGLAFYKNLARFVQSSSRKEPKNALPHSA